MPWFTKTMDVVCREPYRLFFPIGVWMGAVGVSPWLLYALGLSSTYSGFFHSSMQMLVYMNCFVVGFLMTFIPRFTGTFYARRVEVFSFLFVFAGMAIFLRREAWVMVHILYLGWVGLLILFLIRRIPQQPSTGGKPPAELIWIPVAIFHALAGTIMMLLVEWQVLPAALSKIGRPMMEQGFLMSMVIGIGGFLIPRILGTYQTASPAGCGGSCACSVKKISPAAQAVIFHVGCGILLFASYWLKGAEQLRLSYLLQFLVAAAEFCWTGTLPWYPRGRDFYGKLAWLSCWMIVLGLGGAAFFPQYDIELLHITFIGGFSLMTFAIATMVIFSHSGQAEQLKKPLWVLWVLLGAVLFTLLKRLMVILYPDSFFQMLGVASTAWMIGAGAWLIFVLPKLFLVPNEDEFAKMHTQAKQRFTR